MEIINTTQTIIIIALSLFDTFLTYVWADLCLNVNPKLKMKQVESNPFICTCWNNYGLLNGSILSGGILLAVQILLSSIHNYVFYIIVMILCFATYNHLHNFYLYNQKRIPALIKPESKKLVSKKTK